MQAKRRATKIRLRAVRGAFLAVFNLNIYRPEVADDVLTGATVDEVEMDVPGKFGDSMLNSG